MSHKEGFSQAKYLWKREAIGLLWWREKEGEGRSLHKRSPLEPMGGDSQLILSMCRWLQVTRGLGFGKFPRSSQPSHFITPHLCILNLFLPSSEWMSVKMRWDAMRWCDRQSRALKWLARPWYSISLLHTLTLIVEICRCVVGMLAQYQPYVFGERLREFVWRLLLTCWHKWRREAEGWFQSLHFSGSQNPLQVLDPSENRAIWTAKEWSFLKECCCYWLPGYWLTWIQKAMCLWLHF